MNKKWLVIIVVVAILAIFSYTSYNGMVVLEEDAKTAWSNVESEYQRRNDLIGSLVKTVKGAADFERTTLEAVINARANATKTQINVDDLTPENMAKFQKAQAGLSGALSRLLVTVERYPDLKANENFLKLQDELASTENSVRTARNRYNGAVNNFNKKIKQIPAIFFAKMFGFDEMTRFKAAAGSENAPDVDFDFSK